MGGDGPTARPVRPSEVGVDRVLVGAVLALAAVGVVMVYSSGAVFAAKKYGDATYFLKRELIYAILGLGALSLATRVDYSIYRGSPTPAVRQPRACWRPVLKWARVRAALSAGSAPARCRSSPASWPSSRSASISRTCSARKAEKVRVFSVGFLPPLLVTGLMMVLLLKQPDFGTAAIFGAVALGMLFVAGTRTSYLILAALVAAPVGWKFIVSDAFPHAAHARVPGSVGVPARRRLPDHESLMSVGSGGVTGIGLGDGRQKLFFLPEAHTDFILSIVGEELGPARDPDGDRAVRRAGLARLPDRVPRARRVRRLPGRSASRPCSGCRRW
jgi:cell division protein FtsW